MEYRHGASLTKSFFRQVHINDEKHETSSTFLLASNKSIYPSYVIKKKLYYINKSIIIYATFCMLQQHHFFKTHFDSFTCFPLLPSCLLQQCKLNITQVRSIRLCTLSDMTNSRSFDYWIIYFCLEQNDTK